MYGMTQSLLGHGITGITDTWLVIFICGFLFNIMWKHTSSACVIHKVAQNKSLNRKMW